MNAVLTWTPLGGTALLALVSGAYDLNQNAQPDLTSDSLIVGEITGDGEPAFIWDSGLLTTLVMPAADRFLGLRRIRHSIYPNFDRY